MSTPADIPAAPAADSARTLVVTGRGGSGRTTVAAATALRSAQAGRRTLLIAADDPHRCLDEVLGVRLGPVPGAVGPDGLSGLHALHLDPQAAFQEEAGRLLSRAKPAFDLLGVEPLEDDELTALPGAGRLTLLRALREHSASGEWETVVVDAPPAAETVAALALPEQLARYLRRLLPQERRAARALRPVLAAVAGVPMPADWLFDAAGWAEKELGALRSAADASALSLRLVLEPGPLAAAELRLARAGLALYGRRVDSVVANRLLPASAADEASPAFLRRIHTTQQQQLAELYEELAERPVRVLLAPHLGRDPRGWEDLAELTAAVDLSVPAAPAASGGADGPGPGWEVEDRLAAENLLIWRIPLPGALRSDLDLIRRGDELVLGVGPYRRTVPLPSALRRCTVAGAGLKDGLLSVRFRPDPALWPVNG